MIEFQKGKCVRDKQTHEVVMMIEQRRDYILVQETDRMGEVRNYETLPDFLEDISETKQPQQIDMPGTLIDAMRVHLIVDKDEDWELNFISENSVFSIVKWILQTLKNNSGT